MKRKRKPFLSVIVSALCGAFFVSAIAGAHTALRWHPEKKVETIRITLDPGGGVFDFYYRYSQARLDKTRFIIDGPCISACTMITALIPDDRVCVTPYAKLAFHSATQSGFFSAEGTRLMWRIYPEKIRAMLRKHDWDGEGATAEHPNLIYIEGDELLTIFRACPQGA